MVAALVFSWRFMEDVNSLFHVVLLVFLAAMVGFCLSGDLFNLFVFFELMGAAAYVLAGFMIEKRAPLEGSFNFAVTNSTGGILILLGISLLYGRTGALNLAQIGVALNRGPLDGLVVVAFALIVCGFMVKAAIVPFHFWLADAYAVAPTPVCVLFAGAMSELGLLGIARVYWTMFHGVLGPHDAALRAVLVAVGLLTGLLGAVLALAQRHLKRLLAFATISYIGLFMIGLAMLTPGGLAGSAAYVVGDGFVKASLFVAVGIAQYRLAGVEEARLHGHGQRLWFPAAIFLLGGLAIAGLPPFGPFLGHSLVEDAAARQGGYGWVPAAMLVISALAGAAVLRAGARVFLELGPAAHQDRSRPSPEDEDPDVESDAPHATTPALLALPAVALLVAGLVWGMVPGLSHSLIAAAVHFTDQAGYAQAVLAGTGSAPSVAAGGGPTGASYLYGIAATLAAVSVAGLALYLDRLPQPAARALAGLRGLHSGRIGDYIAWLSVGVATIGGAFALTLR